MKCSEKKEKSAAFILNPQFHHQHQQHLQSTHLLNSAKLHINSDSPTLLSWLMAVMQAHNNEDTQIVFNPRTKIKKHLNQLPGSRAYESV